MKKNPGLTTPLALAIITLLAACSKSDIREDLNSSTISALEKSANSGTVNATTLYGPTVQMGNGMIKSFAVMENHTGKPLQIGLQLTSGSLSGFPQAQGEDYLVKMHPQVQTSTVFNHVVVDWNPSGHQPFFYLSPHFDFHFYMMTESERAQVTDPAVGYQAPVPGYLPADYIGPLPDSFEPEMGSHAVDKDAPEIPFPWNPAPQPFSHTFIYGLYGGKATFYEPMVTHSYLMNAAGGTFNIKQPEKFSKAGYYPTKYGISRDENGTRYIVLSDFLYHQAD